MLRTKDKHLKRLIHSTGLNNMLRDEEVEDILYSYFEFLTQKAMREGKSLRIDNWGIFYPKTYVKKEE